MKTPSQKEPTNTVSKNSHSNRSVENLVQDYLELGSTTKVGKRHGISRQAVHEKLKRAGIDVWDLKLKRVKLMQKERQGRQLP